MLKYYKSKIKNGVDMKFIHTADLHLDSNMDALSLEKSRARREELIRSFERLVDFAKENSVRAIIVAGDMFDTKKVSSKTRGRIIHAIESNPEIDFLYLSGNHDADNFIASLEEIPSNLKLFTDEWTYYRYGDSVITGARLSVDKSGIIFDTLRLNPNDKNIVVLHGQIAEYNTDKAVELISLPKLKNKNVDYLALGHIHAYSCQKLDERGVYCYSGCPEGRGFDELGEKGFVLIDTDGEVKSEFIKFSTRELYAHEFDLTDKPDWYTARAELKEELKTYPASSLIKVVLTGEISTDFELDAVSLAGELNERFYYAKVYDRTETKIELKDYEADKSVKGEFVRTVLASELDEKTKRRVILCGLNALKGKEI